MTKMLFAFALAALPIAALADTNPETSEAALLSGAKLTLADAGALAVQSYAGTLSGVVFGDENGKGVFEAEVLDAQGKFWTIKIDAVTGEILAQGSSDMMEEQADGGKDVDPQDGSDGETNDDGATNG